MPEPTSQQLVSFIRESFNRAELEDLCFKLGVKHDDVKGETLSEKMLELVLYMERRGRLAQLREEVARERPEVYAQSFPAPPEVVAEPAPPVEPPALVATDRPVAKRVPIWAWALGILVVVGLAVWAGIAFSKQNNGSSAADVTPDATRVMVGIEEALPTATVTLTSEPRVTPAVTPILESKAGDIRTVTRGGVAVEQVFVPAGSFMMGGEDSTHKVTLNAYWLDRTEVTNAQFAAFAVDTGYETVAERDHVGESPSLYISQAISGSDTNNADWQHPHGQASDLGSLEGHPVVQVTWDEAKAYCEWAGGRLPTEAEWEYAARGPENFIFPWGNLFDATKLNYCDRNCPETWADLAYDDGYQFTAPVGSYPGGASWVGALDMSGNVNEWVNDFYSADYYSISPETNPIGPVYGTSHVLRGGAWNEFLIGPARLDTRAWSNVGLFTRGEGLGFRCAQDTLELTEPSDATLFSTATITPRSIPQLADIRVVTRGSVEVEQVYVPAGSFMMGSEDGEADERPVHKVTLDAFWIDRTEVTNAQYEACVSAGVCRLPSQLSSSTRSSYYGNPQYANYPVMYVSWEDARDFAEWAGGRLPTEADWEYAARGPENFIYPWGNEPLSCERVNYNGNCGDDTSEVGSYPNGASWVDALDMAGNVSEWVNDWYDGNYYERSPAVNPPGPDFGEFKIFRGSSSYTDVWYTRTAFRFRNNPDIRFYDIGFRVAEPLSDPDS